MHLMDVKTGWKSFWMQNNSIMQIRIMMLLVFKLLCIITKTNQCCNFHLSYCTQALDSVQYFLVKLGIKPRMHLWEISIFFTKACHRQIYQNYEQPPQSLQNLYFQSHFSASTWIFMTHNHLSLISTLYAWVIIFFDLTSFWG